MANEEIRRIARANFIPLWKLADAIGISEPTLTRWLRVEMKADTKEKVMSALKGLVNAREEVS